MNSFKVKATVKSANWYSFTFETLRRGTRTKDVFTFPNKQMKLKIGDKVTMEVRKA